MRMEYTVEAHTERRHIGMRERERVRKKKAAILLCAILLTAFVTVDAAAMTAVQAQGFAAAEDGTEDAGAGSGIPGERRELKITVVEDIPAAEIEDEAVPLAGVPGTETRSGMRHMIWMGALLAAAIVYVIYFTGYDRRLFRLRKEAARAEQACRIRHRTALAKVAAGADSSAGAGSMTAGNTGGGYEQ